MKNPYQPPKNDSRREYDRWLETANRRDETDWAGFIFVLVILFIFFFQPVLIDFFIEIFKKL